MIKNGKTSFRSQYVSRPVAALVATAAILFNLCPATAQRQLPANERLNEDQRILHVLNRLGFGARPGDVARVKAMGLDNYIGQQLNPEKISDSVAEAKLKDLPTLSLTTAQLYERYPQPAQVLRQLQRRGELPADLAQAQKNRVAPIAGQVGSVNPPQSANDMRLPGGAGSQNEKAPVDGNAAALTPATRDDPEYRRAIREYYEQHGLQLPQRILGELQASRILRAVYSERQLQEVMVDFWTNHFNVFAGKGADRWLLTAYDRDTIRPHALGKFSELLQATAQSPAMLFYLDNFQSVSPNAQPGGRNPRRQRQGPLAQLSPGGPRNTPPVRMDNNPDQQRPQPPMRRGINENYARELMELHTLGVAGGYTQQDVQEVARCFTGWTIFAPRGGAAATQNMPEGPRAELLRENAGKFFFNPRTHDDGEKIVLGHKIPAGGGVKDGQLVLEILAQSPATARFIATKLVRHFVSDEAPPALVERVAAAFTKSDGDIRETLRAIFVSREFNSPAAYRAKVKRPFELAISAIRTLGAETNGGPQLHQWLARMGEPLYGFQTPNGYSDTAASWVNTGGLLERLNFGLMLAANRIPGTRVDLQRLLASDATTSPLTQPQILDRFANLIVAGPLAPQTKETLLKQLEEKSVLVVPATPPAGAGVANRQDEMVADGLGEAGARPQIARARVRGDVNISDPAAKLAGLILGSPEFQRQ